MTAHELLAILAPPTSLIESLEQLFATREAQGKPVSPATLTWLKLWQDIRSAEPTAIDGVGAET